MKIFNNKDHSASNTRTTENDAQFISIYTKLDEIFHHNTSLGVTISRTCPIVPFYCCTVVVTISEHQWELSSVVSYCLLYRIVCCIVSYRNNQQTPVG